MTGGSQVRAVLQKLAKQRALWVTRQSREMCTVVLSTNQTNPILGSKMAFSKKINANQGLLYTGHELEIWAIQLVGNVIRRISTN